MKSNTQRALRWTVFVVLVLVAGYGGLRFGGALRGRQAAPVVPAPEFPFKPGDAFPNVQLADSLGATVGSADLVMGRHGAVVLFLDPTCDGCTAMATRWERGVTEGVIEGDRVIAITTGTPAVNSRYRASHALTFPVYQDVEAAFLKRHGVVTYPMEMVVGASGTVRALSTDSKSPIDGETIRSLVEQ